jgi:hypothetical protein
VTSSKQFSAARERDVGTVAEHDRNASRMAARPWQLTAERDGIDQPSLPGPERAFSHWQTRALGRKVER